MTNNAFGDHVSIRLISQLIKIISRVLQKLLQYFNGTTILTSFVLPAAGVFPEIFTLDLNEALLPGRFSIAPASVKAGSSI